MQPTLEFVFEIEVLLAPEQHIGRSTDERLSFTPITGGTVRGPRLQGRVIPGGGDWGVERFGTSQLDARYLLETEDGTIIDIQNRGYYRASDDVEGRLDRGEVVPESEYYFRTAPVMQTDSAAHRWLAENQFIGLGRVVGDDIAIRFYLVR